MNTMGERPRERCQGKCTLAVPMGVWPQRFGIRRLSTIRAWESPMVATVSISRGDRLKRRTTRISTAVVRTTTATSPVASPRK